MSHSINRFIICYYNINLELGYKFYMKKIGTLMIRFEWQMISHMMKLLICSNVIANNNNYFSNTHKHIKMFNILKQSHRETTICTWFLKCELCLFINRYFKTHTHTKISVYQKDIRLYKSCKIHIFYGQLISQGNFNLIIISGHFLSK